jgi:fibronectin type 3 domain-containing protein
VTLPFNITSSSAHSVALAFTASTTPSVSYKIYRSTSSGGPYTNLASGLAAPSFTDAGVQAGTTYYYVATAFNNNGESAYSNQAVAVIPTP